VKGGSISLSEKKSSPPKKKKRSMVMRNFAVLRREEKRKRDAGPTGRRKKELADGRAKKKKGSGPSFPSWEKSPIALKQDERDILLVAEKKKVGHANTFALTSIKREKGGIFRPEQRGRGSAPMLYRLRKKKREKNAKQLGLEGGKKKKQRAALTCASIRGTEKTTDG